MTKKKLGIRLDLGWLVCTISFAVGLGLIAGSLHLSDRDGLLHHTLRDLGIAFIVAAVVTAAVELHIRERFQLDTIDQVFGTTMGALWNIDVWRQVRKQIFDRKIIREEFDIHLSFLKSDANRPNRTLIQVRHSYYALSLMRRPETILIKCSLDKHISDKSLDIPRFTFLRIGEEACNLEEIDLKAPPANCPIKMENDGETLITQLKDLLPEKDSKPVRVELARKELVYIPGSYILVMAELTKVANVHLLNLPENIEANIYVPTQDEAQLIPLHDDEPVALSQIYRDLLLLPGQTIEFRFKYREDLTHQPKTGSSTSTTGPVVGISVGI